MSHQGTITEQDRKFIETWANESRITNTIVRLDSRGNETHQVITGVGRTFMVSTEERMIMQDKVVDPKNDPFKNGDFRPVVVPDSVTVETNPNALTDDQMKSILVSSDLAWGEWLRVIDSPQTLSRMVELADQVETFSLARFKQLGARLSDVKPVTRVTQKDQEQYEQMGGTGGAPLQAGQGPMSQPPRTGSGGRSSDYR